MRPQERFDALLRWRRARIQRGDSAKQLPTEADLRRIAQAEVRDRASLFGVYASNRRAVQVHAAELLDVLQVGTAEARTSGSEAAATASPHQSPPPYAPPPPAGSQPVSIGPAVGPAYPGWEFRTEHLTAWCQEKLDAGVPRSDLPSGEEIAGIAAARVESRRALMRLPAMQRPSLHRWDMEILNTIRQADSMQSPDVRTRPPTNRPPGRPIFAEPAPASRNAPGAPPTQPPPARPAAPPPRAGEVAPASAAATPSSMGAPGFAPFDLAEFEPTEHPENVDVQLTPDGSLRLRWRWVGAPGVTLFRVVSGVDFEPWSPDEADEIGVTTTNEIIDSRPMTTGIRRIQVWAYTGRTDAHARMTQPRIVAAGPAVAPVAHIDLREENGQVIARWRMAAGITGVEVMKVPASKVLATAIFDRDYLLPAGVGENGFIDHDVEPGKVYQYRIFSTATLDGAKHYSPPIRWKVEVSAPALPVTDLAIVPIEGDPRSVGLRWTRPVAGDVVIIRTQSGPNGGVERKDEPESQLRQMFSEDPDQLAHPVTTEGDTCLIERVSWPSGWGRVYFTPVTVVRGRIRVGRSVAHTCIAPPGQPRIVQRVHWQHLTFGWPSGAKSVRVFVRPPGTPLALPPGADGRGYDQERCRLQAGVRLRLPDSGAQVYVLPVAYYGGEQIYGPPASVSYPGLAVIAYELDAQKGFAGLGKDKRRLWVTSHAEWDAPIGLLLVFRYDRLPLSSQDGQVVWRQRMRLPRGERVLALEFRRERGYLRLFADPARDETRDIAVLDPALSQLEWLP